MEAAELEAKAAAASISETGQARLNVIKTMIETYQSAGTDAEKVFILNMLPEIITQLTSTVNKINIDKMSVIDQGGNGANGSFGRLVNQMPSAVLSLAETIENATGINIFNHLSSNNSSKPVLKSTAETIVEAKETPANGTPIVD
jgi:flotillin